ncbi:MAG: ABC transporter permease [Bacteroidia bacterium]|nr:ABC transporter permease [Bacteroidia bacterium]
MFELIKETSSSIRKHKTRSMLTGLGISWGMFILIILLGIGQGLKEGTTSMFSDYATNSVWVTGGIVKETKIGGKPVGSIIKFDDKIIGMLKARIPEIQFVSPEVTLGQNITTTYRHNSGHFEIKGVGIDYKKIKTLGFKVGRDLNVKDFREKRRNVIIGEQVGKVLFGQNVDPIGKSIDIAGVYFKVVGVIEGGTMYGMMEENSIYMSDRTLFSTFGVERVYSTFGLLMENKGITVDYEDEIRECLSKEMGFLSSDTRALYVQNIQLQVEAFNYLFVGLNVFIWFVGCCILLCGIIGVTNIMYLSAKERSREFGIRKAIGATSGSILILLTTESLVITAVFGLLGMAMGYFGLNVFNEILVMYPDSGILEIFGQASINTSIVIASLLLLIACGIISGLLPARKAASVMPIEALSQEN